MQVNDSKNSRAVFDEARRLLKKMKSGGARLWSKGADYKLSRAAMPNEGGGETVSPAVIGWLLRQNILRGNGAGELLLVEAHISQPAQQTPGFDAAESPLSRLRSRRDARGRPLISEEQFLAGERIRADFERTQMTQRTTSAWGSAYVDRGTQQGASDNHLAHLADGAIDARRRLHAAFDAVGPELAATVYYVCCLAAGLEQAERALDLPARSGKAVLSLALTRLARHYGLLGAPQSSSGSPDISHWALADYRPVISPEVSDPQP